MHQRLVITVSLIYVVALACVAVNADSIRYPSLSASSTYDKCGFTSDERFATWFEVLFTDSPVLFPRNDEELAALVVTAKQNGCKVRVRGAGHSEDGLVMQKTDALDYQVVVVNLKNYIPDDAAWNAVLDPTVPSVKMSAGASTLDLMGFIRPKGYLTRTGTIGRLFALGGVYLNPSTFGAFFGESRLSAQVLSVRVMNADGNIAVYSGEDVKVFRGSMGLLGIITALEIRIRKDTGLRMHRESMSIGSSYNQESVRSFFQDKLRNNDGD
jgi:FAD/FMN-containing dehydrogenase